MPAKIVQITNTTTYILPFERRVSAISGRSWARTKSGISSNKVSIPLPLRKAAVFCNIFMQNISFINKIKTNQQCSDPGTQQGPASYRNIKSRPQLRGHIFCIEAGIATITGVKRICKPWQDEQQRDH